MELPCDRGAKALSCLVAVSFLASSLLAQETASEHHRLRLEEAERKVRRLDRQFAEILTPTALESELRAKCTVNCSAPVGSRSDLTVARALENLEARKRVELGRVGTEIQRSVDEFVVNSVDARDSDLDQISMIEDLSHVLSGVAGQPPAAFILSSGQRRALLLFDNISNGTEGDGSSYAALTAFNVDGQRLIQSDSTGDDMDGYAGIDMKQLPSPVQGELWLLVSGYMTGANGPNCRMRVFAYNGDRFRTVWAPANTWGSFTTQVTNDGFVVRGEYYRSTRHRYDRYHLASDGLYVAPSKK